MPTLRLSIILEATVAETLRRWAAEREQTVGRYLTDLIREDAHRAQDELAAEGYRVLSEDTAAFAAAAWPLASEMWPEWTSE